MLYKFETDTGKILIDKAVIRKIVMENIDAFEGKVRLVNTKGQSAGLVSKLSGFDESSLITIAKSKHGIEIRMNIIIRFGSSINKITDLLISSIRENVMKMTDIRVDMVTIVIVGMMAKRLVRRNIEVKG